MTQRLVVAITGASGAIYASRLLHVLWAGGCQVHVTISPSGLAVMAQELGVPADLQRVDVRALCLDRLLDQLPADSPSTLAQYARRQRSAWELPPAEPGQLIYHRYDDFSAPPASGSFLTAGMVICPCSGSTLAAVAHAAGSNLIHRAADVHLKERRRLLLVPRETPVSTLQLENWAKASQAGATVLPAMPGWYHQVRGLADLVDFVVARVLDQLQVPHQLMRRWGQEDADA